MTLSAFLSTLKDNALWKFAWGLFVAYVLWLGNFFYQFTGQMAQFREYEFQIQKKGFDANLVMLMVKVLDKVVSGLLGAKEDFKNRTQVDDRTVTPSDKSAESGLEVVEAAREALIAGQAVLNTMRFENAILAKRASEFVLDLDTFAEELAHYEAFYKAVINKRELPTKIITPEMQRRRYNALARISAFEHDLRVVKEEYQTEIQKYQAAVEAHEYREYASIVGGVLAGGFFGIAISRWRRQSRNAQEPPASSQP